ncbi:MAG TPA: ABC transporter permease [Symbiobacteriaceae bacterium]|jgi:NitT/TauT family transport system permease protein|nr:ABC transporter permease [Symbiobacteriaceae bacterium]
MGAADRRDRLIAWLAPLVLIALWEVLVRLHLLSPIFVATPTTVLRRLLIMGAGADLWLSLGVSLLRVCFGFLLGAVPGLLVGLTMGLFRPVRAALEPIIAAWYPIPKLAIYPLIMLFFGIGETSKVVAIASGVFFMVQANATAGVLHIDQIYLDVARNYGAKRLDFYLTIAFPGALPSIFTGLKLGMGFALLLIVAAEMIGAKSGIGYMIWTGYQTFDIDRMFVGLVLMSLLGFLFTTGLNALEKVVVPWKR